jgi:hypothetical protein
MSRAHAYPPDLASFVETQWPSPGGLPLSSKLFSDALAVAYQASLTSEEGRPTRFRLLLTPVDALPELGVPNQGVLRLRFETSRSLHADELRRLSPSAPFETALIGAHAEDDRLRIWGIAHSGPAWLAPTWGGRSAVPIWTDSPIVHVTGPGQLAVRCAGKLVGALERGEVVDAMMDVFDSAWLPALFARQREEVLARHAENQAQAPSPTLVEHSLVGRVSQHMLRRTIQLVRGARHGGLLLIVDPLDVDPSTAMATTTATTPQSLPGLRLKYRFRQDEPAHRARTVLFQILERLAASSDKASIDWSDFAADSSSELEQLEQSVFELSRVMANFTAIDGALILDKRMSVLGFGAEVSAELPSPTHIFRALDTEGATREPANLENVGTRHRAAYRFVQHHPKGLAVVVSQDGGVSFVANRNGEVTFWEQSVSP